MQTVLFVFWTYIRNYFDPPSVSRQERPTLELTVFSADVCVCVCKRVLRSRKIACSSTGVRFKLVRSKVGKRRRRGNGGTQSAREV